MRMAWLLGWAVPEAWFAPQVRGIFREAEHTFIPAGPETSTRLETLSSCDWLVGYSLGAQLLLAAAVRGRSLGRVTLLAPIFAFPQEEALGGRVSRTQVRHLARWMRRDPAAALADFYARAGLDVPASFVPQTVTEELLWGLRFLENERIEPPPPPGWRLWCGTEDSLLDAKRLCEVAPQTRWVRGTHHPRELLQAIAEDER